MAVKRFLLSHKLLIRRICCFLLISCALIGITCNCFNISTYAVESVAGHLIADTMDPTVYDTISSWSLGEINYYAPSILVGEPDVQNGDEHTIYYYTGSGVWSEYPYAIWRYVTYAPTEQLPDGLRMATFIHYKTFDEALLGGFHTSNSVQSLYDEIDSLKRDIDISYDQGYSAGLGDNFIGKLLSAPFVALNNVVLYSSPYGDVTLGGIIITVIAIAVFVVFLKMFAGG